MSMSLQVDRFYERIANPPTEPIDEGVRVFLEEMLNTRLGACACAPSYGTSQGHTEVTDDWALLARSLRREIDAAIKESLSGLNATTVEVKDPEATDKSNVKAPPSLRYRVDGTISATEGARKFSFLVLCTSKGASVSRLGGGR